MNNLKSTDLELLTDIKNDSDSISRNILWNRYQGKIKSSYYKNRRYFDEVGISMRDYEQDAFFAFTDCINYINLEKITFSKANFGTSFYFFLLKIKNKSQREIAKSGIPIYLSQMETKSDDVDSRASGLAKQFNDKSATTFDSQLEKKTVCNLVQDYIQTQSDSHKQVLQLYISGVSVKDISESLEIKYSLVYRYIRKTKDLLTIRYKECIA